MNEGETCATCRFWVRVDKPAQVHGHCHAGVPVTVNRSRTPGEPSLKGVWPTTWPTDWCGQWMRRDE